MRIQVLTNLFPLPWQPNRATFNKQQFIFLARECKVSVLVIVSWLERLRNGSKLSRGECLGVEINYCLNFYFPGILRFTYPLTLFLSLLGSLSRIKRYKPDCLIFSWAYPDAVSGILIAKLLKKPAIIKVHGSDINVHGKFPLRARQIRWAMNHADAVVTVSKALAEKVIKLNVSEEKVRVIYNGIDRDIFHPVEQSKAREILNLDTSRRIILFVGNLKVEKGCTDLFNAFRDLAHINEEADLYYIGEGQEKETILKYAESTGIQHRIKVLGSVNHGEIANWLNASDVVALPSHNEGVPNVLLEAMACGKPVVATRVGGIPEIVSECSGLLVGENDPKGLTTALEKSLSSLWNSDLIVKSVAHFTWENNIEAMLETISKAIKERQLTKIEN